MKVVIGFPEGFVDYLPFKCRVLSFGSLILTDEENVICDVSIHMYLPPELISDEGFIHHGHISEEPNKISSVVDYIIRGLGWESFLITIAKVTNIYLTRMLDHVFGENPDMYHFFFDGKFN